MRGLDRPNAQARPPERRRWSQTESEPLGEGGAVRRGGERLPASLLNGYLQRTVVVASMTLRKPLSSIVVPPMDIVPANSTSVWVDLVV